MRSLTISVVALALGVALFGCAHLRPPAPPAPKTQLVLNIYPSAIDPDYVLLEQYVQDCQTRDDFLPPVGEIVTQGELQIMLADTTDLLVACAALQRQSIEVMLRQAGIIRGVE